MLDLSCRDWEARIRAGRSLLPSVPVDESEARRAVGIYNKLILPDVPGQPALGEAGADWFREIVSAMFGAITLVNDRITERLIRELFCLVPKKNSKTTNGAAMMLTALLLNRRPRGEMLLVGPTQDVAKLAFSQVCGMIEGDPEGYLQKRMHIKPGDKEVLDRRTKAILKVKSFDSSVVTGVKPIAVLLDEIHEIGKSPDASRVLGQLRGGLMPNVEAFLAMITTQSDKPPAGVFKDELMKARAVRDGKLRISLLPVLYEFPAEIAAAAPVGQTPKWADPSLWWMVTPNRGRSVTVARMEEDFVTAQSVGLAEVQRWASQHLNIEIGLGLRTDRWRGADYWEAGAEAGLTFASILERCDVVVAGIDGGGMDDLLSLSLLGRERESRAWLHWGKAWAHEGVLELRKSEASKLRDFEADGDLMFVTDLEVAYADLAALVAEVKEAGLLGPVGLDPEGVGALVDALAREEISGTKQVVGVSQGYRLNGSIKTAEVKVANRTLRHCGQALMSYAVGNAKTEAKGNAVLVTKAVSGAGKIDPLMSLFDAVALMTLNPSPAVPLIEQGFVVL